MTSLSYCCCSCSMFSGACGFPSDTDLFILFILFILFTCCWVRISAFSFFDSRPESFPPSVPAGRDEVAAAAALGFDLGLPLPFLPPAIADRGTRWCELPPPMTVVRFTRAILLTLLGSA